MGNLWFFIVALALLSSCNTPTQKHSIVLEDTTGFYKARNMKGIAEFFIDSSTYHTTLDKIKAEIRLDYKQGTSAKYTYLPKENITDMELFPFRENQDSIIKTIDLFEYFTGSLKVNFLKLTFLNDTLVEITCDSGKDIEDALTQKYGQGKVFYKDYKSSLIWQNANVKSSLYYNEYFTEAHIRKVRYDKLEIYSKARRELIPETNNQ